MSEPNNSRVPDTRTLAEEHERLGQAAVRLISDYARALDAAPVCSKATPEELVELFDEPLPQEGVGFGEIFEQIGRDLIPPAMSVVEARVLRWLCQLVGYGPESFGTLTSGGSEANLVGLKCARDRAVGGARDRGLRARGSDGRLVVYASEQCHYSFVKSVDILGLGRENLRKVETDSRFHIRTDRLRERIARDLAEGHTPVCVAGAAGATSTGVVDPLDELADVAREDRKSG